MSLVRSGIITSILSFCLCILPDVAFPQAVPGEALHDKQVLSGETESSQPVSPAIQNEIGSAAGWKWATCLRKGISLSIADRKLLVPGYPAMTIMLGSNADDEISFSTSDGLEKACLFPNIQTIAITLDLDVMDKPTGMAARWRQEFCNSSKTTVPAFVCKEEKHPGSSQRQLARVVLYDPQHFDDTGVFRDAAPKMAEFTAWKERVIKTGTPPPTQADGDFDVYPGSVWLERAANATRQPFLFTCNTSDRSVAGGNYCIGELQLSKQLMARIEFRAHTKQPGHEASEALGHFNELLTSWRF